MEGQLMSIKPKNFYEIKVDSIKKHVRFDLGGKPTEEEAAEFIKTYQNTVNSIDPSQYDLILDCEFLSVVPPSMLPALEACFELYRDSGFKTIVFNLPDIATLQMQIHRLSNKHQLVNSEIKVAYPKK